jgi:hypothetical protein
LFTSFGRNGARYRDHPPLNVALCHHHGNFDLARRPGPMPMYRRSSHLSVSQKAVVASPSRAY